MSDKTTHRFAFTMPRIEAIAPPSPEDGRAHTRAWYYDDKQPGLALMVTSTGVRTFYLVKRVKGRPQRVRLGRFPEINVARARTEAARLAGEIAVGMDPQEIVRKARRASASVPTFQAAWNHYRDKHLKVYCSPKTVQNDGYFFDCVPWKDHRLDTVTIADVKAIHLRLTKERGPTMANRVVQLLQRLYNYAIDEMGYQKANPVRAKHGRRSRHRSTSQFVPLNKEKSRDRYLLPEELPRFFTALRDYEDEDFRDLVLLLLFTGVRRNNVQAMRWEEVDLERALWTIPKTKNGDELRVPLSRWALEVLARRAGKGKGTNEPSWVFPSPTSASGHLEEPKSLYENPPSCR